VRVFLTGGTGFVGGRVAAALRARGDEVVALVRSPEKAAGLDAELVTGDLGDEAAIRAGMEGADALIHAAAEYRIGIPESERPRMRDVNVGGTERVLDAAIAAGVPRIVHVSTANVFGDTRGRVVDERYERPAGEYVSYYDETKLAAHRAALERAAAGAPVVIAAPGVVYGPGDTSQLGGQLRGAARGRLPYVAFPTLGFNAVHVDDVADGILRVLDRGRPGETYVLGGELTTMRGAIEAAARAAGRRPPRLVLPTWAIRASAPLGRWLGPLLGQPPNIRELVSASDGVTYWASDAKAREELGYRPRGLADGLRDLTAAGR
jgi:dihydroflavonol-4-reductase